MGEAHIDFDYNDLQALEANAPAVGTVLTTAIEHLVADYDDTTQEYLNGQFTVPPGIDTSGTATFRMSGFSGTAAASKNVAFDFDHAPVAHAEDLDSATYTSEASGDKATVNTQNALEQHEWTETISNMGWVVDDTVFFRISRQAAGANNLVGDWRMDLFTIFIPMV